MSTEAKNIEYIDIGPKTWVEALPLYIALLENGTAQGRKDAKAELLRMAQAADSAAAKRLGA